MGTIPTSSGSTYSVTPEVSRDYWLLMAVVAFGAAGYFGPPVNPGLHPATLAAGIGLLFLGACLLTSSAEPSSAWLPVLVVTGLFLSARIIDPFVLPNVAGWSRTALVWGFPIVLVITCVTAWSALRHGRWLLAAAVLAVGMTAAGAVVLFALEPPSIDVLLLHDRAAEVVAGGGSPYGDLVTVPDTSPFAPPGHAIVGYPYPPLTALAYIVGVWVIGDSRWISLVAMVATATSLVILLGREGLFQRASSGLQLVSLAGWPVVLILGFTEPLTLVLITLGLLLWDDHPSAAAVLVGLAIASKQYMLVVAPLLLIVAYRRRPKYAGVMVLAGVSTILPNLLLDGDDLIRSIVTNLANLATRPDGSSIQGLLLNLGSDLEIPLVITLGVPLMVGSLLATRTHNRRDLAGSACLVLTTFFLLGSQAFLNYWFLVAGLAVVAYALPDDDWIPSGGANLVR